MSKPSAFSRVTSPTPMPTSLIAHLLDSYARALSRAETCASLALSAERSSAAVMKAKELKQSAYLEIIQLPHGQREEFVRILSELNDRLDAVRIGKMERTERHVGIMPVVTAASPLKPVVVFKYDVEELREVEEGVKGREVEGYPWGQAVRRFVDRKIVGFGVVSATLLAAIWFLALI